MIGAGSATFSLGLMRDLCLKESLWGSTVTFMDINKDGYPGALPVVDDKLRPGGVLIVDKENSTATTTVIRLEP